MAGRQTAVSVPNSAASGSMASGGLPSGPAARIAGSLGPGRRRSGPRLGQGRQQDRTGAAFVAPHLLVIGLFMIVPTLYAVYTSLFSTKLIGGTHYSGLANYRTVLSSSQFWDGVQRVIIFGAIQVPVTIAIAFFFAAIFDAGMVRFGRLFRTIFFMPFAVPGVVAALMWSFLLLPKVGPYSRLLTSAGLGNITFFSSRLIVPTIILIVIWEWTGYNMTILYTSLKSIPREVTEAAIIDGAKLSTIILRIRLPMVRPSIIMLLFLNTVGALQLFTEPSILATFQPQAISYGFTPSLYVYNTAIGSNEYNLGAAAAVVLAVLIGALSLVGLAARRRTGELR